MINLPTAKTSITQLMLFWIYAIFLALMPTLSSAAPPEIKAVGNHLENKATGAVVRLTGVNLPSLQWGAGENLTGSATQILGTWKANIIRLPINQASWNAGGTYLTTIDAMVAQASTANAYILIDLHNGTSIANMPDDATSTTLWPSIANRYKNNPAVLFGIYNEPAGTTDWNIWRNGGTLTAGHTPGAQTILDSIRATGANNLIVAGGIKWASDLSGFMPPTGTYALTDTIGNGVMYDAHIYAWHQWGNWTKFAAMNLYPLLLGECGHDGGDYGGNGSVFGGSSPLLYWTILNDADALGVNFTAWAFHPRGGPSLINDVTNYTPDSFSGQFVLNHILSLRDAAHASTLANPSFETVATTTFTYRPTGASWTFAGNAGIQKTWGNTIAPGSQTAFLQTAAASDAGSNGIDGSISQNVNFVSTGTYTMSFLISQRGTKGYLPVSVLVDGVPITSVSYTPGNVLGVNLVTPVTTAPFTINTTGTHAVKLVATSAVGLDLEALIDNVTITKTAPAWLNDQGFQYPSLTNAAFAYRPTGTFWTWVGNAGIERNALGAPSAAPDGAGINSSGGPQAAFLQTAAALDTGHNTTDGSISQNIEFAAPGGYVISFFASMRTGKTALPIQVLVDGGLVGTITPGTTAFASYSTPTFTIVEPGYHLVTLAATPAPGLDQEAFIDGLKITVPVATVTKPVPIPVACAGFETPSPAFGHGIQPTGTPWTYTGTVVGGFDHAALIMSDGASASNYNGHHAAEGWQAALLTSDGTTAGTISQSINFPSAGTYVINFQTQHGNAYNDPAATSPINVSVGGVPVGTVTPPHAAYYPYTTPSFVITTPGNYTVMLAGTTAKTFLLLDAFNIWRTGAPPNNHYLHANMPITDDWTFNTDWFDAATGGTAGTGTGLNPADYYYTNGLQLRSPGGGGTSITFGGTLLTMNGGSLLLKYQSTSVCTIPNFDSSGGSIQNGNVGTEVLNVTAFDTSGTTATTFDTVAVNRGFNLNFGALTGTGPITFSGHGGGVVLITITDASHYTGTMTFLGTSTSTVTFQNAMTSAGALIINTGNVVTLNANVTFAALTVNGTVYAGGTTYPASTFGFGGTGSITVP